MMKSKIRYQYVRNTAMKALIKYNMTIIGLPILEFVDRIKNVRIMSYSEMATDITRKSKGRIQADEKFVQDELADGSQDGALIRMSNHPNEYIILYNSNIVEVTPQRIRFTIAHELGHFFLVHKFVSQIARQGISKEEYDNSEKEADLFASTFLIPPQTLTEKLTADEVRDIYDVSNEAAKIALDKFHRLSFARPDVTPSHFSVLPPRSSLIQPSIGFVLCPWLVYCPDCNSCHELGGAPKSYIEHCPLCGSINIRVFDYSDFFVFSERKVWRSMEYTRIPVDNNGRAQQCPRCDSDVLNEGDYCRICGAYLINKCTGVNPDDRFSYNLTVSDFEGCEHGHALPGDARYCPYCGSLSTFAFQALLPTYTEDPIARAQSSVQEVRDKGPRAI